MKTSAKTSSELAKIFFEIAYYDEMQSVPFKPRAYQLASESMAALGNDVEAAWRKGGIRALKELPGVGQSIAEKIDEYFRTGKVKAHADMKKKFPVDIWSLSRIEGLGPKHIHDLYTVLKVKDLGGLKKALASHKVRTIPRWGEKSEEKLARELGLMERASGRHLLGVILPVADDIVTKLSKIKGVKHCVYAGSLRRKQETIGDIDLIATTSDPERVMDAFVSLPMVETVQERGKTRSSVRLTMGIDADLRVVPDAVYGATLQYFTGDKRHNVLLREYALSKHFTLNEYGLFRLKKGRDGHKSGALVVCKTEEEIYRKLGMDTPPPELRVGGDELDAAREHRLPKIVPYGSVRGDLQVQTNWTDGSATIEKMAVAAKNAGLSYMAVTDHTKALAFVGGLDDAKVAKQGKEIDRLNKKLRGFLILKGTECDILKDGSLDLSDKTLATLDWVGISVHSHFNLPRAEQTRRVIQAISNPNVDCLFHPTCRLIGKREGIDLDMDEIVAAAKKYRVALEIDAHPDRTDLRDLHVRMTVKAGVKLVIDTDAHAPDHFRFIPLGEAVARRGWATKNDILNTKTASALLAYLDKKRKRA
ncbi:DNA polymerase/3'-5' exonuclease PolX [Candidatus Uhrbacteria bacterium]|nr:DNA polymerase/3'-5' exonuclease PolX [Candidatus Uhrbacteria bacterium]